MTLQVNKLSLDVFQHETEDQKKIFLGLAHLFPEESRNSLDKIFKEDNLIGYYKNNIKRYYAEFSKNKNTQNITRYILQKVIRVISYYDLFDRISENGELFIRLNKQDLIRDIITLDNSSDVYKIVIKFLFFNKKVNKIESIYEYLQSIPLE